MKYKNRLTALMLGAAILLPQSACAANDGISVYVDGDRVGFDVAPVILNDRTMVPMRAIFEELGAEVSWDAGSETASGKLGEVTVNITIDEPVMYRNGKAVALDSPAVIIDGRTLVPVRAISESFGCSVTWDGESSSVYIVSESGERFVPELVPEYSGSAYTVINDNDPYFTEVTDVSFEDYSELDYLGRCGEAYACLSEDTMPDEERGDISSVTPTGWVSARYDFVDGTYLYNRCHLIGFQLSAENANERNLITGTRYMNVDGMLQFENMTADYIEDTGNHVMYRVTPDFRGSELVARGVLMEAQSVEDDGEGLSFNVYCYNVQPGVTINYADGSNYAVPADNGGGAGDTVYILNTRSMKFHYPDCSGAENMSEKNKREYTGTRDELIAEGYSPCGICSP